MTCQGHPRSKVMMGKESSHDYLLIIYWYLLISIDNSNYMARKLHFENAAVWTYCDLDLTFQGHPRTKVMRGNESSHMTSYLLVLVTKRLGSTVLKIQLFENSRPWFDLSRSSKVKGHEGKWSSHMTSYLLVIGTKRLGSTVLKIQLFENIVTLIWPFRVNQGQRSWGEMKFIYDFLSVGNSNFGARKHRF